MNLIDAGLHPMPLRTSAVSACVARGEVLRCEPGEGSLAVRSDVFELLWLREGTLEVLAGARHIHLEAGTALLVPPSWTLHWRCLRRGQLFHTELALDAPSLAGVLRRESLQAIGVPAVLKAVAALADTLAAVPRDAARELRVLSAFLAFVASLEDRHAVTDAVVEECARTPARAPEHLAERLAAEMCARVARGESVVLATLAAAEGVCAGYANRLFHQRFGMAPREYLSRCRTERACELLLQTSLSLELIAERLGFAEASHFTRQFKRRTGLAPSAFRAKARGGAEDQRSKLTVLSEKSIALGV
ncbi:helix-turn-helix domain-containing protein [Niveibacterium sp. SC-1]|uniref:helix-turn-helix domain-containing protein n=1 Tax=Niveibacterium sp. SC-1 TaxID=3135646 RepID=UPI00311FFB88